MSTLKNILIYLFLLLNIFAFSQNDTLHLYQLYSSFNDQEKAEWTSFENNWSFYEYQKIKDQSGIKKLNCSTCESLYADIYIEINEKGIVHISKTICGKQCGLLLEKKELVSAFENSVIQKEFRFIKNRKFVVRLGHALKC